MNPERQAKRRKSYAQKLAAYKRSETYKLVEARANGQCEFIVTPGAWSSTRFEPFRCNVTRGEDVKLHHHHLSYARFAHELPEDIQVLCPGHHALVESQHPTRQRGRSA